MSFINPVLVFDSPSNKITDVNVAATELTGYSREELLGRALHEIYSAETASAILRACVPRHVLSGSYALSRVGAGSLLTKTGAEHAVEVYCQYIQRPTPRLLLENRLL
jgi:PAS domain S-box-containing protein